jgi:hypothetical protein
MLYVVTKPKKNSVDGDLDRKMSFKGAMKYSPAAMRQRTQVDEMHL